MKSTYIQFRIDVDEKRQVKRLAKAAGMDLSQWIREKLLSSPGKELQSLVDALKEEGERTHTFAAIHDFLATRTSKELEQSLQDLSVARLPDFPKNYLTAMVEHSCMNRGIEVPSWTRSIAPLSEPYFATSLKSLRLHLLVASPAAFRRRNIFIDSTVGSRV